MKPVRLLVYQDFLCPWCYVGHARLAALKAAFGEDLEIEERAFLLRPEPAPEADLGAVRSRFGRYRRLAREEPRCAFQPWRGERPPRAWSLPAQVVHRAARERAAGPADAFRLAGVLFRATFAESLDVAEETVLRGLWQRAGLSGADFPDLADAALQGAVRAEHREALELGVTGVPAVRPAGLDFALVGAQPEVTWRRLIERQLAA